MKSRTKIISLVLTSMVLFQSGVIAKADGAWVKEGNNWTYQDKGIKQTGWLKNNDKWYYFDNNGIMKIGWIQVSNQWYYFYSNGEMAKDAVVDGYKVGSDGVLITDNKIQDSKIKIGSIKGAITWQYNKFIGTKADTGATVSLFPVNFGKNIKNESPGLFYLTGSINTEKFGVYSCKADGYGNYQIDDVVEGEYYLVMLSNNTNNNSVIDKDLEKAIKPFKTNFTDKWYQDFEVFLKMKKHEFKKVTIKENKTIIESYDFGYSYR